MSNIDTSELEKFDTLEDWWDTQGNFKALHDINPIRLQFITDCFDANFIKDKQIADIGCGGGILTESLAKLGGHLTGVDASQTAIDIAKAHAQKENVTIDYQCTTVEAFAEKKENSFDIVVCMELLEHVPDPASVVNACATLVKPEGRVFFSTLHRTLKSFLFAILGAEYILGLVPKGTHEYAKFIRPSELRAFAHDAELEFTKMKGMRYNPLFKEYSLTEDVSVNYLVCCEARQ